VQTAPPPAAIRDAIKSGAFDAVVFTSSSTVRNLVGIAGKPHASTVVACIGPQTAKTVEEHAMRVDVLAGTPSVEVLADSLAAFAVRRRDELVAAGEPVVRPSQRRRSPARRAAAQRRAT
jgi:uroporphyrinogen III methyltransferase / synthase